jgi:hypothetical protein
MLVIYTISDVVLRASHSETAAFLLTPSERLITKFGKVPLIQLDTVKVGPNTSVLLGELAAIEKKLSTDADIWLGIAHTLQPSRER